MIYRHHQSASVARRDTNGAPARRTRSEATQEGYGIVWLPSELSRMLRYAGAFSRLSGNICSNHTSNHPSAASSHQVKHPGTAPERLGQSYK